MPKFTVTLKDCVPVYYYAEVEVEADTEELAISKAREMAEEDEVDWIKGESDYDSSKIVEQSAILKDEPAQDF